MIVTRIWEDCIRFKVHQDGFWVCCTQEETINITPFITEHLNQFLENKDKYLSTSWVKSNPGLAESDSYYFLVSKDGTEIIPSPVYYPYAGLWNAYNPFKAIKKIIIKETFELQKIDVQYEE